LKYATRNGEVDGIYTCHRISR